MLELNVAINGKTLTDLEMALDEVKRAVCQGYLTGANRNDDGNYSFTVAGEEEPDPDGDEDEDD